MAKKPVFNADKMVYLKLAHEIGEGGKHHWQGYLQLRNRMRLNAVTSLLCSAGVHLEMQRARNNHEAANYIGDAFKSGEVV